MMGWDIFIYFAAVCIVASLMASVFSFSNRRILAVATAAVASISLAGFIGLLWISLERPPLRTMGETSVVLFLCRYCRSVHLFEMALQVDLIIFYRTFDCVYSAECPET